MSAKKPINFSWIIEGLLAGCAYPDRFEHYQYMVDKGIRHLVTLTERSPPPHMLPENLHHHHLPIPEFDSPTIHQMHDFTNLVRNAKLKNEGVAVHCFWGRGRTGTMLAACLVGMMNMEPDTAIREIRKKRPYSIETYEQEEAIQKFSDYFRENGFEIVTE